MRALGLARRGEPHQHSAARLRAGAIGGQQTRGRVATGGEAGVRRDARGANDGGGPVGRVRERGDRACGARSCAVRRHAGQLRTPPRPRQRPQGQIGRCNGPCNTMCATS